MHKWPEAACLPEGLPGFSLEVQNKGIYGLGTINPLILDLEGVLGWGRNEAQSAGIYEA